MRTHHWLATLGFVTACVTASACVKLIPFRDPMTLLEVDARSNSITKNGLTITVTPIDVRNASLVDEYRFTAFAPICQNAESGKRVQFVSTNLPRAKLRPWIFEPCCTFSLRLKNDTGHTISLAGATIQLEDGQGKSYEPMKPMSITTPWPTFSAMYRNIAAFPTLGAEAMRVAQQTVPIPDGNTRILPGKTKSLILPFDVKTPAAPLKVMLYDVITKTDAAGNAASRDRFEVTVNVQRKELWRVKNQTTQEIEWLDAEPTTQCE